jgi:hypothetical protein
MWRDARALFWMAWLLLIVASVLVLRLSPGRGKAREARPTGETEEASAKVVRRPPSKPKAAPEVPRKDEEEVAAPSEQIEPPVDGIANALPPLPPFPMEGYRTGEAVTRRQRPAPGPYDLTPWYYVAESYHIHQLADPALTNEAPQISDAGLVVWRVAGTGALAGRIAVQEGPPPSPTLYLWGPWADPSRPVVDGQRVAWTAWAPAPALDTEFTWHLRRPAGVQGVDSMPPGVEKIDPQTLTRGARREVYLWSLGEQDTERVTRNNHLDAEPSLSGEWMVWLEHHDWPYGSEVMLRSHESIEQLTVNSHYDLAPRVNQGTVVWMGWDGKDFEIFAHPAAGGSTTQLTHNAYDDVDPQVWRDTVVWEAHEQPEADVYLCTLPGSPRKLGNNKEDDVQPRIWGRNVVWQGFDGKDFEIYLSDDKGARKLTENDYDDVEPQIRDGFVCWTGYEGNNDGEIFLWNGDRIRRLTSNNEEDAKPMTAGGRVVWQAARGARSYIFLAVPQYPIPSNLRP